MTRVTNLGRKRTYLEAGFGSTSNDLAIPDENREVTNETKLALTGVGDDTIGADSEPPKKKKRIRKKKPKANLTTAEGGKDGVADGAEGQDGADGRGKEDARPTKKALKKQRWKEMEKQKKQRRLVSSEMRRQKRINERNADTTCFACREKGHAAKDCPNVEGGNDKGKGKNIVGICYRWVLLEFAS
ncbi:hypothetical protein NP233_g8493 [Leucocoprinus birnbaumii]|uniref:CCHC-type domain-containing protein n=1 Tax=Leucocoprinus birnbaumii TaxID=56174 RepID=A0AAD5VMG6_9AGAR|nr:hypothetical protein NP233_g8493 [Leucocoprinus birnbaumii]